MTLVLLPILVCVVGLVIYLASSRGEKPNAAVAEIGRIMFFCGLLATLLLAPHGSLSVRL